MIKAKVSEVILDYNLYPRSEISAPHLKFIRLAHEGGAVFPPIVIDKKSKRVTDGFHRVTHFRKVDKNMEVDAIVKNYKNESEMFRDAMRLNANHGRPLTPYDRVHCLIKAKSLKITNAQLASDLCMTKAAVGELRTNRIGNFQITNKKKTSIPLKRTIKHMHGKTLTSKQQEVNEKLSGMNQVFYVNQVISLIESNLLDTSDDNLMDRLNYLCQLLADI